MYEKATDTDGRHVNISTGLYDILGRIVRAVCYDHDGLEVSCVYDAMNRILKNLMDEPKQHKTSPNSTSFREKFYAV